MIPGLGRPPGEGNSDPLQYSGLEKSMECIVHGVAESRTQLSNFHFHTNIYVPFVMGGADTNKKCANLLIADSLGK